MTSKEWSSLAYCNQREEIVAYHHKRKAETGEEGPLPPLNTSPDEPSLKGHPNTYLKVRSLNAVRHGLTGQTVVMPWEDRVEYDNFCRQFLADLKPVGFEQTQLAQTVADCQWRLNRASSYENSIIYYQAFLAYQGLHEEALEEEMSKARVAESIQRHLLNLSLYESRLQRKMMNARKALKELQQEQSAKPQPQPTQTEPQPVAPAPAPECAQPPVPAPQASRGPVDFVFSDLETFCTPPPPLRSENPSPIPDSGPPQSIEPENLLK